VLPPVVDEASVFPFKFWLKDKIHEGMYYRSELFYRLYTADLSHRAKLYHHACKMSQQDDIVVTTTQQTCSIWISLRSPNASQLIPTEALQPPFLQSTLEDSI
jgi:hypothetical protein